MRCLVRNISRKRSGISHDDHPFEGDHLVMGRAPQHTVFLSDLRVALTHARISRTPDGQFQVAAVALSGVRLNGETTNRGLIKPGDTVQLGACTITVVEPPEGYELCLEVEQPRAGQELTETLQSRSVIGLEHTGLSKRTMSWALFLTLLIAFLVVPVAGFVFEDLRGALRTTGVLSDQAWDSGRVANVHQFIGDNCNQCHVEAFVMVQDTACVSCHRETSQHADPVLHPVAALTETRCGTCHKEHNAPRSLTRLSDALCADCHSDIQGLDHQSQLLNVSGFTSNHPEFRPTLYKPDGSGETLRVSLNDPLKLKEASGLRFDHEVHLAARGITGPGGAREVLDCASCHTLEPGGVGVAPISMENHCQRCHTLGFDPVEPAREVPHGDYAEVIDMLEDYYARRALKGGYTAAPAPAVARTRPGRQVRNPRPPVPDLISKRRRPGVELTEPERQQALAWAEAQWRAVAEELFEYRSCNYCHEVSQDAGSPTPTYRVAPVRLVDQWLPLGVFTHVKHRTMQCDDCHDARVSTVSEDVLLPGIQSCYGCHGGPDATDRLASQCVDCHKFHNVEGQYMGHPPLMADKPASSHRVAGREP